MSILIEDYPALDIENPETTNFIWFISAADPEVLAHLGVTSPPSLGQILIDNAIVLAQNAGFLGGIGLHAAKAGGPPLLEVYQQCGLQPLPAGAQLPSAIKRANDGRFFLADGPLSETLAAKWDPYR